jgi:hypothetical protein
MTHFSSEAKGGSTFAEIPKSESERKRRPDLLEDIGTRHLVRSAPRSRRHEATGAAPDVAE